MTTFTKTMTKHIFVHPAERKRLLSAIKYCLLKDRKKYSDRLEGALLDVTNIKIVGDRHLIVEGYISMDVVADFQVFSPKVGLEMNGVVNKISSTHLGCLVMDTFNAALSGWDRFSEPINLGDTCTFVVNEVIVDGEILFLRGTLKSITPCDESEDMTEKLDTSDALHVMRVVEEMDAGMENGEVPSEISEELLRAEDAEGISCGSKGKKSPKKKKHKRCRSSEDLNGNVEETKQVELIHVNVCESLGLEGLNDTEAIVKSEADSHETGSPKKHKKRKSSLKQTTLNSSCDISPKSKRLKNSPKKVKFSLSPS